jgi:hypothetical protein
MSSNNARVVVGRLLEVRVGAGFRTVADVDALFVEIARQIPRIPAGQRHVAVVDWRRCPVMAPEAAQRLASRIATVNDTTLRSAALASPNAPTAILQFMRVIRDAGNPDRKLFENADELYEWLGEVLDAGERTRLRAFLSEAPENSTK